MERDGFITLFGSTAMWPLGARAQQPQKLPIIGFLGASSAKPSSNRPAFLCNGCAEHRYEI
jgi:hypothetical protein